METTSLSPYAKLIPIPKPKPSKKIPTYLSTFFRSVFSFLDDFSLLTSSVFLCCRFVSRDWSPPRFVPRDWSPPRFWHFSRDGSRDWDEDELRELRLKQNKYFNGENTAKWDSLTKLLSFYFARLLVLLQNTLSYIPQSTTLGFDEEKWRHRAVSNSGPPPLPLGLRFDALDCSTILGALYF